jgi:hypothetical protein
MGERKPDLEPASHLIYGEVGYAFRHLDSGRLRRPLHTTGQQEDNANTLG